MPDFNLVPVDHDPFGGVTYDPSGEFHLPGEPQPMSRWDVLRHAGEQAGEFAKSLLPGYSASKNQPAPQREAAGPPSPAQFELGQGIVNDPDAMRAIAAGRDRMDPATRASLAADVGSWVVPELKFGAALAASPVAMKLAGKYAPMVAEMPDKMFWVSRREPYPNGAIEPVRGFATEAAAENWLKRQMKDYGVSRSDYLVKEGPRGSAPAGIGPAYHFRDGDL